MLKTLERLFVRLNQGAVVAMMMVMATVVFVNVVTRYALGFSLTWSEELARYLMIWVTYLGAGLAMREGRHVAIEYFQALLPGPLIPYFRAFVGLVILIFLGFVTVLGFQLSSFAWQQRTPVLELPQGLIYLAIPLGAVLFGLHLILIARDFVQKTPNEVEEASLEEPRQGKVAEGSQGVNV